MHNRCLSLSWEATLNAVELARLVAAELGPQIENAILGDDATVASASDMVVHASATYVTPATLDAATVANFVIACSARAMMHWQSHPEEGSLVQALYADITEGSSDPRLLLPADLEQRLRLIARVVERLTAPPLAISTKEFTTPTVLQPFRDMTHWIVREQLDWTPPSWAGGGWPSVVAPVGFVSDLASIPFGFRKLVHPTGSHGHAAILHDWLYWEQSIAREIADRVFDIGMAESGVNQVVRKGMWASVRVFGGIAWDNNSKEKAGGGKRILKRFPSTSNTTWEDWRQTAEVFA